MKCIGATTTQEAKSLLSDPAFNRRFSQLTVDELTSEQTLEILINSKAGFFKHYNNKVTIDDDTLKTVVTFANEYKKAGNHRPDNALTLLDRSISDAIIDRKVKELQAQASGDQNLIQAFKAMPIIPLTERQIKKTAINLATGNSKPTDFEEDAINDALSRIKGQDEAITSLVREGFNRSTSSQIMTQSKPLSTRQIDLLLSGKEPKDDIEYNIENGNAFISSCKEAGIPVKYLTKRYFIEGFMAFKTQQDLTFADALDTIKKLPKLSEDKLKAVISKDVFKQMLEDVYNA